MWKVVGSPVQATRFREFTPAEVLYEFDGPRTFTLRDGDQELYLAHWIDEDEATARYLMVVFSEVLLARLKAGQITVREALDQPSVFVADIGPLAVIQALWSVRLQDLPPDVLPHPGSMLLPCFDRSG